MIKFLGAELNAHARAALEVDGPLKSSGFEPFGLEDFDCFFDGFDGNNKVHISGHHRLVSPMVHGDSANRTPRNVRPLEAIDETHHIVGAASCLPIVKPLVSHG